MDIGVPKEANGYCHRRFMPLLETFHDSFNRGEEVGAAVAIYVDGECLVDLWGGRMVKNQQPAGLWRHDTIVRMMSINKATTALCAHRLADQGRLEYDAPVARYWPEFAQSDKQDITVRQLLSGMAALVYPDECLSGSAFAWDLMVEGLARQRPAWPPGTRGAYHSSTYGHLVGEIVRRVSGQRPSEFFRHEIAVPFGIDYWFRVPSEEHHRVSEVLSNPDSATYGAILEGQATKLGRAWHILPSSNPAARDAPEVLDLEMPSGFGRGNARAVAKLFSILATGGSLNGRVLLSPATIRQMTALAWDDLCGLTDRRYRYAMGLFLNTPGLIPMGLNPDAFGHAGAGGAIGFADPERRLAFSYCTSFMCEGAGVGSRCEALINAAFACL